MHGKYVNPGNKGFERILNSEYIDKTGIISLVNNRINSNGNLICISRPRRFGKSFAAQMLCAYYDCSCDSRALFKGRQIEKYEDYDTHLNRYNVICFDVTSFISECRRSRNPLSAVPDMIEDGILRDLRTVYSYLSSDSNLTDCLLECAVKEKRQFICIIDEWDALIREAIDEPGALEKYMKLLHKWFGNKEYNNKVVAAAFITGILPMTKGCFKSEIPDFSVYPVTNPREFAEYTGFNDSEVLSLCQKYGMDFDQIKDWYRGYELSGYGSVCNPYSVLRAVKASKCRAYWTRTSAGLANLLSRINIDFNEIKEELAHLAEGKSVAVDVRRYAEHFRPSASKDDILTLLIHLGYLTYRTEDKTVRIPNNEIRAEFKRIMKKTE